MAIILISYIAVNTSLSLTYGIWLSVLAPVIMIVIFSRDNNQWYKKHPEFEQPRE
ncbi:hypothetical protein [Moraxella catarrhalis]|uniref:hypothetical protein n=1 Tax=Moraxella catarrhalis TaxID=480 RepID=UPI0007F44D60|nr:hypothetical protein [Moraxella catarrhalis]OAV03202.1 hypothetical protein AO385_0672 [Moraxella catarrhalis]